MIQLLARVLGRGGAGMGGGPGGAVRGSGSANGGTYSGAGAGWGAGRVASKDIARERLKLMLVHDRVDMEPELMEALKDDLIRAISRYLEVDRSAMEVSLHREAAAVALVATIPVRAVRRRPLVAGEEKA
ncbi:cell division topological specificity factor MinE [Thermaerobacter marianensis DSM 12885]|uniref:Cell division topological specificity factor n=1 Tax=Thermaerobacter marianensis (strain ATCC 700841 / DSM 12885 / JCM 10246 / 7p75a) TaxID=644966 RepID=E6SKD3_THEM7|nr:cell division topological specificity factor MinE [Thermaerobacter marianensis DSM 12885]